MQGFVARIAALLGVVLVAAGYVNAQSVSISPGYLNIGFGQTQQYTAIVTGLSPETVKWAVTAGGGSITQAGVYTAPMAVPANGALISATSIANPKIVAYTYVNPEPGGPTIVAITPNPMPTGNNTVTITASAATPFVSGASMLCGGVQMVTKFLSPTMVSAQNYIAPSVTTLTCTVSNPGTMPGNALTVPVRGTATPAPVVSPAAVSVGLGASQQFSAANVTSWSASYGKITSTGLYTAPAAMPASGTDTITATGASGSGTAIVTLQNYPAPTLTSISPSALPLGIVQASIGGAGFTPQSTVTLGGTPLVVTGRTATSLTVTGFAATSGAVNLVVSNGSLGSAPLSVYVGVPNAQVSAAAARRFLEQAAFGPTSSDAAVVQTLGFQGWLNQQFAMPQVSNYNAIANNSQGGLSQQFMVNATMNPDQLRQRVAFALSQIFVTSVSTIIWNNSMIPYEQMLMADSFTNYRKILGDVTVSPTMGQYLDMANNAMANPATGTVANENYAREVMQLFSIGTTMLNPDGTPKFDSHGLLVPAYTQATIGETARVFTGWTYQPTSGPLRWNSYINPAGPMMPYSAQHDFGTKTLVNGYVAKAGLSPQQDLDGALDNIFNHPNVGPFVGKLLIQHLVKSNPSAAYVQRVAAAFADNGHGVRGDMQALISAILLDPEARANDNGGSDQPQDGHLQEPILYVAGIMRAFNGSVASQNYFGWDLQNLGEDLYNPASVFNYFSPSFAPPGSTLLGPEFQIDTPDSAVYRANVVANLFSSWSSPVLNYGPGTSIDVTPYLSLAPNPPSLVAALDLTLTHGTMPAGMKQQLTTAVMNDTNGNLSRVLTGAWLILSSGYYNVWH